MSDVGAIVASVAVFLAVAFLSAQYLRPLFFDYHLAPKALEVRFFGHWTIHRVPYAEISALQPLSPGRVLLLALSLGAANFWVNRVFAQHLMVESNGRTPLVITPKSAGPFMSSLRSMCAHLGAGGSE